MKLATMFILCALSCRAAEVQKPQAKFFTRAQIVSLSIGAAVMTADMVSTRQALAVPGTREANPLMRNQAGAIALKAGLFAATVSMSYAMHRTGHDRIARTLPIIIGAPSLAAAVHNWRVK